MAGEKVSGKTKQFSPTDFLRRAEKLSMKYCENELMLKNIRGTLAKIEGISQREPSTMQSIKTIDQTGMVSYLSDKKKTKEAERSQSHTASINSRMLKKSQFSQPKMETLKRTSSGKNFRVTSNPKIQTIDQIRNLFSGVVQIKVEPNIRIVTQGSDQAAKKPIRVRQSTESRSIVCSQCQHHMTLNESHHESRHSEVKFTIKRHPSSGKKEHKKLAKNSSITSSGKESKEDVDSSLHSRPKIPIIEKQVLKHRRQSQEITSNTSLTQQKRGSYHKNPEVSATGSQRKSGMFPKELEKVPYEVKATIPWDEDNPQDLPRPKKHSELEIQSAKELDRRGTANDSNFVSSPELKQKINQPAFSSGDEKEHYNTPVFNKKPVEAVPTGYTQSKFKEEAQRNGLGDHKYQSSNQPVIVKKPASLMDNYWQIPGDKEYRVNLHKTIYQET